MGRRGRPRLPVKLDLADRLRASGLSWGEVSKMLDVHRNTLLAARQRHNHEPVERFQMPRQKRMLLAAQRYLKADRGEGLTTLEIGSAEELVRFLATLYRENADLREALGKAQAQIRDMSRELAR